MWKKLVGDGETENMVGGARHHDQGDVPCHQISIQSIKITPCTSITYLPIKSNT